MERDALYYPHIDIQDVEWLKRTLLTFPHVARIVPREFDEEENDGLKEFEDTEGRLGVPLLRRADLLSGQVWRAQQLLLEDIRKDIRKDAKFIDTYGKPAKYLVRRKGEEQFVIHPQKVTSELINFLEQERLIWSAGLGGHGRNSRRKDFVEVHPSLGEAIMSTLAIACAKDEGFEIVTDSGEVHRCLAEQDEKSVYKTLMRSRGVKEEREHHAKRESIEVIIFQRCDTTKLTPKRLAQLRDDWDAITKFRQAMEALASSIPPMRSETKFVDRLKGEANGVLDKWRQDKVNMGAVAKEIFGVEGAKPTGELVKKLIEQFGLSGAAGVGAAQILGLAPGILIGFAVHGITSWGRVRERSRNSPYHYLTKLEKAGVAFSITG